MSANFWTFLTFLFEIQSSKMTSMYRLSPIISPETMVFDMPTTMYKLPMIQNSNNGDSSNQSMELSNVSIFISSLSWKYSVCNLTVNFYFKIEQFKKHSVTKNFGNKIPLTKRNLKKISICRMKISTNCNVEKNRF